MEEVKFRAWDKIEKRMCFVTRIDWVEENITLSYYDTFTNNYKEYERDIDDVELMQYTGETDKNNKEIYESDIIYFEYDYGKYKSVVNFKNGCFDIGVYNWTQAEFIEVIGNKYKNPKLLKEE